MVDLRRVMAGQAAYQRPESPIELAARQSAQAHFGLLGASSKKGAAYRRGFVHASYGIQDFQGQCDDYDAGFTAGVGSAAT